MTKPEQEQCSKGNENDQICADRHQAREEALQMIAVSWQDWRPQFRIQALILVSASATWHDPSLWYLT
jgi:hypothetical protein